MMPCHVGVAAEKMPYQPAKVASSLECDGAVARHPS